MLLLGARNECSSGHSGGLHHVRDLVGASRGLYPITPQSILHLHNAIDFLSPRFLDLRVSITHRL